MANYIYVGSYQLGHEFFSLKNGEISVDMDRDTFKTLWDNYYIPFINGYYGAYANFRSEDAKTGKILALTSSTTSVSYLPTQVTLSDDSTHPISIALSANLPFADTVKNVCVQQGAGCCMLKSGEAEQEGAVEFIKWFTDTERNNAFAILTGYSPVTLAANKEESIRAAYTSKTESVKGDNILDALLISANEFSNHNAYSSKPFNGSKAIRALFENAMTDIASADRETVVAAINAGSSRKDAVAVFSSDEYFDQWFDKLCADVSDIINK